jgi:hypothetical protein
MLLRVVEKEDYFDIVHSRFACGFDRLLDMAKIQSFPIIASPLFGYSEIIARLGAAQNHSHMLGSPRVKLIRQVLAPEQFFSTNRLYE